MQVNNLIIWLSIPIHWLEILKRWLVFLLCRKAWQGSRMALTQIFQRHLLLQSVLYNAWCFVQVQLLTCVKQPCCTQNASYKRSSLLATCISCYKYTMSWCGRWAMHSSKMSEVSLHPWTLDKAFKRILGQPFIFLSPRTL